MITNYFFKNKNLNIILEAVQFKVDELVKYAAEEMERIGQPMTARDKEYYEIAVVSDLIKAFANYILDSDEIEVKDVRSSKGTVTISLYVTRNGNSNYFYTDMIIAEGEIQRRHYRYLPHTSLPKLKAGKIPDVDDLKEKVKRMTKAERLEKDILRIENYIKREVEKTTEEMKKTREDFLSSFPYVWENLHPEVQARYNNQKSEFEAYKNQQIDERFARHQTAYNQKRIDAIVKENTKSIEKIKAKLAALKS